MAYDRIFSGSRSRSRNVQRKNDLRIRLKNAVTELRRLTKIYICENIDLPRNASDFVRNRICVSCPVDNPYRCESLRDKQNRYYCRYISSENDSYVRLYLPNKTSNKSTHNRLNTAKKIEDLIRAEPGIRRTRIREMITGKWDTILDILENDLVFQGRVKITERKEKGKTVYRYFIKGDFE
jgi:hypothetical protein